jgi:hypothetical protein
MAQNGDSGNERHRRNGDEHYDFPYAGVHI